MKIIEDYSITLEELNSLNDWENDVLKSLNKQLVERTTLSDSQNDLLTRILKREFNINNIEYKDVNLYIENFYRVDYHGDYLQDRRYKASLELLDENEQIDDLHASQYNYSCTVNRYKFDRVIKVPVCIKELDNYVNYYMNYYEKLILKVQRAKSTNSKYKMVKALKSILNNNPDDKLLDYIFNYKPYKNY